MPPAVADLHNDLLMLVTRRPPAVWSAYFRDHWLPQLVDGGVDLQALPVFVDAEFRPEGSLRESLRMVEAAHQLAEANADVVRLCTSGTDLERAAADGRIALVLALEGCPQVDEDIELLGTFYRLGVRIASFTHFGRSALGDGSGEDAAGSRLTSHGVRAVAEMESLGMLVDVSHLGARGTEHVLELATTPVIATHSSARALRDHHRNLSDDHLRGIAATGGVIGINFFAPYLTEGVATIDHLVDHFEHVAQVAGIDAVAIGADFITEVIEEKIPACDRPATIAGEDAERSVPGLTGPKGFPLVSTALAARGWSEADIAAAMGGNVRRLLTRVL